MTQGVSDLLKNQKVIHNCRPTLESVKIFHNWTVCLMNTFNFVILKLEAV